MTPEQARNQYDAQGFIHFPGALAGAELAEIQECFERAAKEKALGDLLNREPRFLSLIDHPAWFPAIRAVVGEDVMLRYLTGGIIPARAEIGSGWHCDLSTIRAINLPESIIMTKLFVYLADVPEDGACLAVVPGSHRYQMGHPLPDIARHEDMPHHRKLVMKAGDAVLMSGYTWHARFHNRSDHARKVLESSYIHFWMKTQYELNDFKPEVQERILASHNLRQLFGVQEPGVSDWERRLLP
ncbi:MAG: phytanoyl-CoA dioxygenase family protein [Planctomycetota bacterium]|nr:phytanoyl-CoA dioxygenase family protein [Planctomycetota bacterium]MDA1142059.1 phytanoyl-CoA dioxygenase family protein [Planctomycetota bacterium]